MLRLLLDLRKQFLTWYGKTLILIADSAVVSIGIFLLCITTIAIYTTWTAINDVNQNIQQIQQDVREIRQELQQR